MAVLSMVGAVFANTWGIYLVASLIAAIGLAVFLLKNTATTKKYFGLGLVLFAVGLFATALIANLDTASTFALIGAGAVIVLIGASRASASLANLIARSVGSSVGAIALIVGVLVVAFVSRDFAVSSIEWIADAIGVPIVLAVIGAVLLIAIPVGYLLIRTALASFGISGKLGKLNAARNPARTATTATALMIGVALISTVSVAGESIRQSVNEALGSAFQADLFIGPEVQDTAAQGFSQELVPQIAEIYRSLRLA